MDTAPVNIVIRGRHYECRVVGDTEAEAADTAELILRQLRSIRRIRPVQIRVECKDPGATQQLGTYLTDLTAQLGLR